MYNETQIQDSQSEQEKYFKALNDKRELEGELGLAVFKALIIFPPVFFILYLIVDIGLYLLK